MRCEGGVSLWYVPLKWCCYARSGPSLFLYVTCKAGTSVMGGYTVVRVYNHHTEYFVSDSVLPYLWPQYFGPKTTLILGSQISMSQKNKRSSCWVYGFWSLIDPLPLTQASQSGPWTQKAKVISEAEVYGIWLAVRFLCILLKPANQELWPRRLRS